MLYALGVVFLAVGLLLSIALHEIGHMVPAKRFGVKVTQYMVGFGPTILSRKRGDTEYGLKAIPLGGYIRMIGMVPPRPDGGRSRWPRRLATAVEEFRSASRSEVVDPADEPRQFYRLTPGKKMIVMFGGPFMNFVIYLVLTLLLLTVVGVRHDDPTTTVDSVAQCVVPATSADANSSICSSTAKPAPANGVLKSGDVIEAIDGRKISSWDQAVSVIEGSAGRQLTITVLRNGIDQDVSLTPVENVKYANDQGTKTKVAGYIGVGTKIHSYYARESLTAVPREVADQFGRGLSALGQYPAKIANLWQTVFEGKQRDPQGAVGVVGIGRIGGDIAQSNQFDLRDKIFWLVSLLASLNLILFLFNLLPLLPLDGGHIAGAIVESLKRGRARLRIRSAARAGAASHAPPAEGDAEAPPTRSGEPIYVDTAQMLPVMYAVAAVLILVQALVLYADIVHPISLGG
ncbi:MAG: site-2 protease family protein [Actinobacteria bacterium]|nr:site-2 protease family protein [Actinomycetota bacterium]